MPELPEIKLYLHALSGYVVGQPLEAIRMTSPSLLKSYDPPLKSAEGCILRGVERIGKRIVWVFDDELFFVFHLMVTGRFHWRKRGVAIPRKRAHAGFDFPEGTLLLTEAGKQKRASLHVVRGRAALADHDRGGLEVLNASAEEFYAAISRTNRTMKRALTDPSILSGIGNAHSDEILLEAGLSPVQRTANLTEEDSNRLFEVTKESLGRWTELLISETGDQFPEKVTAFHPKMMAHGKFGEPCPQCGTAIQRIVYASRETNYCPTCQTGGRLLADRALSRLLREDWPRTVEELEGLS